MAGPSPALTDMVAVLRVIPANASIQFLFGTCGAAGFRLAPE